MSGFHAKRKDAPASIKGGGGGGHGKKMKTIDSDEDISKKIMSKYEKMNEELNKAVGTYLGESEVKVETENDPSMTFTELIRSKIGDLEEDDDQEGDMSDDEVNNSKYEVNDDMHTNLEINAAMNGLNMSDLMRTVKSTVISDIVIIQNQVVESLSRKEMEIVVLRENLEKTETDKVALSSKYRKYKEMAVKLSANGNKSNNKDLEEENSNLREKLKTILDKLSNEEESKFDVSSKLALKDQMLKEQIKKNQELEVKIKHFVMSFFDKMESSSKEVAVANLNKSMEESKISDYLEKSNKSLHEEISTKFIKTNIKMLQENMKSEEVTAKNSPKLKKLQVDIQNMGYNTLKKVSMKNRSNVSRNVTKQSFPYDSEKSRINFGVLKDMEVVSSKMQNLINETDCQNKSNGEASSPASLVRYQTSEGENQGKRKNQIRNLSNEISKKKYEIKRLSYGGSSPSSRKDPEYSKESFELMPAVDDDSEVPLKVKIVNMNSDPESEAKTVNYDNYGSKLSVDVLKKSKPNSSLEIKSSPKSVILNPNISIQKKPGRKLPAKLMNNSSISVGRSGNSQDAPSLEESKKKNEKVPLSLPGITMVSSIGLSNPGISIQKSTEALQSNSSISFKKVSQSPSPGVNKVNSVGLPRNSAIFFNRVSTPEGNTKFSRSIKEFPALGNLNLSISRPSEQGNTPKRRSEQENYSPNKHSEPRKISKISSEQVNTPNISTEERGNRPKKAKEQRNQPKNADEQINTPKKPVEHNTPKISSSISFKPSPRRDSLSSYSQLSISKSRVSINDENMRIKPSEDKVHSNDKPVSGLLLTENHLVKIPSDVLTDMDTNKEEHIPWEASDLSTEVKESNAIEGETKSTPNECSVDGHYDMTKYDYLMEKINSQLKNVTEKNHQSELKIKELQHNDDDEIEKLLMD